MLFQTHCKTKKIIGWLFCGLIIAWVPGGCPMAFSPDHFPRMERWRLFDDQAGEAVRVMEGGLPGGDE